MEEAIKIARKIIAGDLDPNDGCSKLSEIFRGLNWPKELAGFELISHEQYGHEHIGITAEDCVPNIVEECEKLVAAYLESRD